MTVYKGFRISVGSDSDYEDLTAEIYFKESFVAIITQEQGFEELKIEIYPPSEKTKWDFKFDDFLQTMQLAKQRLWDLRKIVTIYVRLVDEKTEVYRPVKASILSPIFYKIEPDESYEHDEEHWEFPPGSKVRIEEKNLSDGVVLVASAIV